MLQSLQFLSHIGVTATLGDVLNRCILDLAAFLAVITVVVVAFSLGFNALFCTASAQFGTFAASMFGTLRMLTGGLDVYDTFTSEPVWGPVLYAAYVVIVILIVFSILTVTIANGHDAARDDSSPQSLVQRILYHFCWGGGNKEDESTKADVPLLIEDLTQQIRALQELSFSNASEMREMKLLNRKVQHGIAALQNSSRESVELDSNGASKSPTHIPTMREHDVLCI